MLGAEEKRWLVVGICLSKVLTPVLRNVITADMQQLFQRSILPPTNIHLQTFTSHSKTLTPSTLRLNYANINNNASKGSPNNYDYSVRDELSLAKLFVKPFMASFRGFDETLDSSAALSILCGSPNFVLCGIDIFATDVRSEVRNEWGHCKFAIWTETYYNRCFQLMEDLIKHLTYYFPVFSEGEVLEDLKQWKNRGMILLFL